MILLGVSFMSTITTPQSLRDPPPISIDYSYYKSRYALRGLQSEVYLLHGRPYFVGSCDVKSALPAQGTGPAEET
jgi:hypothetical protein